MKIEKDYEIDASVTKVWDFIQDFNLFFGCIPNIEKLEVKNKNIKLIVKPSLSFIKGAMEMDFTIVSIANKKGKLKLKGKGIGSSFSGVSTLEVKAKGKSTILHWEVDVKVGGLLSPVPESIIKASAAYITTKFINAVTKLSRQALHAYLIGFIHPKSGESLRFESSLPNDIESLL